MTTHGRLSRFARLALLPALLLAGCSSSSTTETTLAYLELVPSAVSLQQGATRKLTVIGTYSDGSVFPLTSGVTFSSSEPGKASVGADGTVTGVAAGAATVVATASGRTATCAVTVTGPTLQSIAVSPGSATLGVGATQALTVTATYDFGPTAEVTAGAIFTSSDGTKASVSATGVVTALATGSSTITANYGGKAATSQITVLAPSLVSIAVTPATATLSAGATQQLTVTGTYSSGPTADLTAAATFASSDAAKALVGATGLVTAVAAGSATITATVSGKTSTSEITVTPRVLQSIAVTPATATLTVGGPPQSLTVTGTYDVGAPADLTSLATYQTSAASVATVSAAGVVTAVAPGPATITATVSGKTSTAAITVNAPALQAISVTPATITLAAGGTAQLTVTATYDVGPALDVTATATYATDAAGTATVSATGLVGAVAVGTATITASYSGLTDTAAVTVTDISSTTGRVFFDDYEPGVSFRTFGGPAPLTLTRDTTVTNNGRATLKVVIGPGVWAGGAFATSVPRDLRAFNALTFWALASTANPFVVSGIGNNGVSNPPPFGAEAKGYVMTGAWKKYVVPLPDPTKANGLDGLFHFTSNGLDYTVWLSDVQYESLPAGEVGAPTGVTVNWPGAQTLAVGATYRIPYGPNTVSFTTPALPDGGSLKDVSFAWYTLTSSDPAVASVGPDGVVSGLSGGTATITATMNGLAVANSLAVTVTAPLAVPTNIATAPSALPADVISMYSSFYTNVPVDSWRTDWSFCCNVLVDPYVISGHDVKQYTLQHFVGIEFGSNPINASGAGMTTLHMDVWTPNATELKVLLVNNEGPSQTVSTVDVSSSLVLGQWVGLDIPLSQFSALTGTDRLGQMQLLLTPGNSAVFYVDNVYFHR